MFQAESKGISFLTEIDTSLIRNKICSDQNRLRQILINLASNSIKYTQSGHVKLVAKQLDYITVEFRIIDTGVGIS